MFAISTSAPYRLALMTAVAMVAGFAATAAHAGGPIDTSQPYYLQSQVGVTVNPDFQGGTLRDDQNNVTDAHNYSVENYSTNTVDAYGHTVTFSGQLTGAGSLTLADSVGGGTMILTDLGNIAGGLTINSGATMQWGNGAGPAFFGATSFVNNGNLVMDYGVNNGVATCQCMPISGSGNVHLESGRSTAR